jgi:transposase
VFQKLARVRQAAGQRKKEKFTSRTTGAMPLRRRGSCAQRELTFVWVPDETHEAMSDLVRARQKASHDIRQARQRIQGFLLRHQRRYSSKPWGYRHRSWSFNQSFEHLAQQIAFQNYVRADEQAEARGDELDKQIAELLPHWSLGGLCRGTLARDLPSYIFYTQKERYLLTALKANGGKHDTSA